MGKQVTWKSEDSAGEEKLFIQQLDDTLQVTAQVKGGDVDLLTSWDVSYRLVCDDQWRTRSLVIDEHQTNRHLEMYSDGNGHWKMRINKN